MEEKNEKNSKNALKVIDIIKDEGFECNGKRYFLEPQISQERYKMMGEYEIELSYATTFKKHYNDLKGLYDTLNQAKFIDAAVSLRDIMSGMQRLSDSRNHHPVMKYCALILNTHEEDRKVFDEKIMDEKIKDWENAGIPINSFFAVVLHSVSGLVQN